MKWSNPSDELFGYQLDFKNASVLHFWLWSYSILSNDPTKGEFAEWMVGNLLGLSLPPGGRIEGADWDHLSPEGVKIEVKAAAYWQAWKLRNRHDGSWRAPTKHDLEKITRICFRGLWKRPSVGKAAASDFKADLYVFCVQHEKDPEKWNGTDLSQWSFYILPATTLRILKKARDIRYKNGKLPKSFDLTLSDLQKHAKRMTALEFRVEAPKIIGLIATELKA